MGKLNAAAVVDAPFDINIYGDELERHRIQLESNLQHTDLSLHLSSARDDYEDSSVEYPRHNSAPSPHEKYASFGNLTRDNFDLDGQSHIHAWSYRTGDDEEGISPYAAETMSTAAHHASALTLSAGLGGRGARRDISVSGAEYDPERPLRDMIVGVDGNFNGLDVEYSQPKNPSATLDPLIIDDTAELDRVLKLGHVALPSPVVRLRSPHSSTSSSASSDSDGSSRRPKLSDALRRVAFSPKRPRSAQSHVSSASIRNDHSAPRSRELDPYHLPGPSSPISQSKSPHNGFDINPTPRPMKRHVVTSRVHARPEVQVQPPTPSTAGSNFTRAARGLAQEINTEQSRWIAADVSREPLAPLAQSTLQDKSRSRGRDRNPFQNSFRQPTPSRHVFAGGKVHLPDVTGLTSAVESPMKAGLKHYTYDGEDSPRVAEAHFISTITAVQSRLTQLEAENSISRRRVRELELELETCKQEVKRERTKVMQKDDIIALQDYDNERGKWKGKKRVQEEDVGEKSRYKGIMEEKAALEMLIMTLRTHLTRLTAELSSHQLILSDLRTLRDSDHEALVLKSHEVDRLRIEVERLAGEVEVLRGVVEEGLKERRMARELPSQSTGHASEDLSAGDEDVTVDEVSSEGDHSDDIESQMSQHLDRDTEPPSTSGQSKVGPPTEDAYLPDRTTRTDHATLGSSNLAGISNGRSVGGEDLERISLELEERRSDSLPTTLPVLTSPSSRDTPKRRASISERVINQSGFQDIKSSTNGNLLPSSSPAHPSEPENLSTTERLPPISASEPVASTSAHGSLRNRRSRRVWPAPDPTADPVLSAPFPQIRGKELERLFFSAPEHNAQTCTMCHHCRLPAHASAKKPPAWLRYGELAPKSFEDKSEKEDEILLDAFDDNGIAAHGNAEKKDQKQADSEAAQRPHQQSRLPPQTVLARVLRELEDDFTHYKSIYIELADQYKLMDAASDVCKRNILAQHLREVVDTLEQKGDQIASLYDLLNFKDKPLSESVVPPKQSYAPFVGTAKLPASQGLRRHPTFA